MIFLDSGFFLAFLDPGDSLHARARAWAGQIKEEMVVTEHVLWETMNFCSKPVNRPRAHMLVNHIRSSQDYGWVGATADLFDAGVALSGRGRTRNGRSRIAFHSWSWKNEG